MQNVVVIRKTTIYRGHKLAVPFQEHKRIDQNRPGYYLLYRAQNRRKKKLIFCRQIGDANFIFRRGKYF